MKRMGQAVIALVAATGACAGGAMAITAVAAPGAALAPAPIATVRAVLDTVAPAPQLTYTTQAAAAVGGRSTASPAGATVVSPAVAVAPQTHAVSGASGVTTSATLVTKANPATARTTTIANPAPAAHARSGASGATTTVKAAAGTKRTAKAPAAHVRTGASGASHEGGEREDD